MLDQESRKADLSLHGHRERAGYILGESAFVRDQLCRDA